jgi:hypothetical protein
MVRVVGGQIPDDPRGDIDFHRVAERLREEEDPLSVGRELGTLAEVAQTSVVWG